MFLLESESVLALDPRRTVTQYTLDQWESRDGLPHNTVEVVLQTRDGYIWIGTSEGLARFDGVRFTVFDWHDTHALENSSIKALKEDRDGKLWIGTEIGLVTYDNGAFEREVSMPWLTNQTIRAFHEDRFGRLWIATDWGLTRIHGGEKTNFNIGQGLAHHVVFSIVEDRSGAVWIGTDRGLSRYQDNRFSTLRQNDGLPDDGIRCLLEDREGNLWIGTRSGGLGCLRSGNFVRYGPVDGLPDSNIRALHQDYDGNIWVGTASGLSRFEKGQFISLTVRDGLNDDFINTIAEDREGGLWVGTRSGGLSRLKDGKFTVFSTREGLPNNFAKCVYEDRDGVIWVGTQGGGLARLAGQHFQPISQNDGFVHNEIWSAFQARNGDHWWGTPTGGVDRWSRGAVINLGVANGLFHNVVRAIIEDRSGQIWMATGNGLSCFNQGRITTYSYLTSGSGFDLVYTLHEDQQGKLWIGTARGLCGLKEGKIIEEGYGSRPVYAIHEDNEGALWIGTGGDGLYQIRNGRKNVVQAANGLTSDVIYQILEDDRSNLWLSHPKGVFRVSKSGLESFFHQPERNITCDAFGVADGMASAECQGKSQPAGCRSRDGRLWFPTVKGVVMIDPALIRTNTLAPPVMVEQVFADKVFVPKTGVIKLRPGLRELEIRYTALSFAAPEKVRFKYKLDGFDADWVDAGTRRTAYYNTLPPGQFRFRVIACNEDGVWSEPGAVLSLVQQPRFYQHAGFWLFSGCIFAAFVWTVHRRRVGYVRAKFSAVLEERTRIARELHDTLEQELAGITMQLDALSAKAIHAPDIQKCLDVTRSMVRHSQAEARRSVWDLRAVALENGSLPEALEDVARQVTNGFNVPIVTSISGTWRRLPGLIENHLLRIGQEAMTNALKHGSPKTVRVTLSYSDRETTLRIEDDGRGFDPGACSASTGAHFGLLGMRERAKKMRAQLNLRSQCGQGTFIEVTVPTSSLPV